MIGELFTTGVIIKQQYDENKWIAIIEYADIGHANVRAVEGELRTKYRTDLLNAIKTVLEDCEIMGIKMMTLPNSKPHLYVKELFSNNQSNWQQIQLVADALNFEVVDCISS